MKHTAKWAGLAALAPACGLAAIALASAPAHAEAILTLNDGGTSSITLNDTATPGFINYSGTLGSWKFTSDTATIEPMLGDSPNPDMHLGVVAYGSGTLNIKLTENDFSGTGLQEFLGGLGGSLAEGASLTGDAWLLDAHGTRVAEVGPFGPFSGFFSDSGSIAEMVNGTYGLEFDGTLTDAQVGTSSFDASVAVPEPGTLALFGAALLGCA
ncbi:MAG: PEP-CTERM sorting domain-containing protein, partial [Steroidobacteraceae bacterium]